MKRRVACASCKTEFDASSPRARYCSDACRAKARRRRKRQSDRSSTVSEALTAREALAELDAALEILPADVALLESRHPVPGVDGEADDLIGDLELLWRLLESVRAWIATGDAA